MGQVPRKPHDSEPLLPWGGVAPAARPVAASDNATPASEPVPTSRTPRLLVRAQLAPAPLDPTPVQTALLARGCRNLSVAFGKSRNHPVQLSHRHDGLRLRLHEFFAASPDDVLDALAQWVQRGRAARHATQRLDDFIAARLADLPERPRAAPEHRPKGRVHDLGALTDTILAGPHLQDLRAQPVLFWGRPGSPRRSLQLGLYDPEQHSVRIHPVLDDESVPEFFVGSVLFHELLHAAMPPHKDQRGRWVKHSAEFRRRERAHPDHGRAERWLDQNISRLIRHARRWLHPRELR